MRMENIQRLLIEMFIVGIITTAVFWIVSRVLFAITKQEACSPFSIVKELLATGAMAHLVFEVSGVNAWYVRHYKPLLS